MACRQIAWCYAPGETLRGLDPTATLRRVLTAPELAYVLPQANRPLAPGPNASAPQAP